MGARFSMSRRKCIPYSLPRFLNEREISCHRIESWITRCETCSYKQDLISFIVMNEGIEEEKEIMCGEDLAYALTLKWSIFWKLKQILKKIST